MNITNLTQVDDRIWRGSRLEGEDQCQWVSDHCRSVVNLEGDERASDEYVALRSRGAMGTLAAINFNWFPIDPEQIYVESFPLPLLDLAVGMLLHLPAPVYVHCQHGQDRTGLLVAAYRMANGMSYEDAYQEAMVHGYRHLINFGLNDLFEQLKVRYAK